MRLCRRVALAFLLGIVPADAADVAEPPGYRMDDYNAPTPATLLGARVLTTRAARQAWRTHRAVFIDVAPAPPRPAGLPAGTLWRPRPRRDIPGSIWLPDVGYGALAPAMQDYFVRELRAASGGARDRPLVIYCRAVCWHSWNAAKRAVALGYSHVVWYRGGTDAWGAAGLPLVANTPVQRPDVRQ